MFRTERQVAMKRLLSLVLMLVLSAAAFAVPSVDAVQAEVNRGNYAQAESMMREVVADKPNSAKAHYIYAEVLAHNGRFEQAADEARLAKQIDPQIKFTQADKFRAFEQLLQQEQGSAQSRKSRSLDGGAAVPAVRSQPAAERSSGVPGWVWGAGFAVIAVLLWRLVSATRQRTAAAAAGPAAWSTANTGPSVPMGGPSYGQPGYGPAPGVGSGMLGTGIAAAGGFAAGMLAEKLFDGHRGQDVASNSAAAAGAGGLVPGMFDDNPSADELERRSIDFGNGGNDWDSDTSSSDSSSSSSDDGW